MTKDSRHNAILQHLMKHHTISVTELADLLNVSLVTIRKDLTELEQAGKLYRSHGGAKMLNPFAQNRTVSEKEKLYPKEKAAIAQKAASLVLPSDSIAIASGTSLHALARMINPSYQLTVVSASLIVSEILGNNESMDVIQLGGMLRHSSFSVVGKYAEDIISQFSFSKFYLGVDGIDIDGGISTTDMREALLNQQMIKAAQKTIVLADSSKFGRRGFAKICDLEEVDMIITDNRVSHSMVTRLEDYGVQVVIVNVEE